MEIEIADMYGDIIVGVHKLLLEKRWVSNFASPLPAANLAVLNWVP
jgi:hypothetical protein